ncbi:hypothetical protein OCAE111667_04200 [Occultella aeris]|uniref:Uncharacterized protein n=1 Tax=Occultella aeris TaxID=2761496 RepID=A0A7M4DG73_9MICO|nr:hypothetical protein HALOF300_01119 [Occultella aeris]
MHRTPVPAWSLPIALPKAARRGNCSDEDKPDEPEQKDHYAKHKDPRPRSLAGLFELTMSGQFKNVAIAYGPWVDDQGHASWSSGSRPRRAKTASANSASRRNSSQTGIA